MVTRNPKESYTFWKLFSPVTGFNGLHQNNIVHPIVDIFLLQEWIDIGSVENYIMTYLFDVTSQRSILPD